MRTAKDPLGVPGVLLIDHPVAEAGRVPLPISSTASGESFAPGVLDEISRRLADLPLLGLVGSMEEVLGPDYHPTAPQTARPGLLVVVSPIVETADGFVIGVQAGPPGGAGWDYIVAFDAESATVIDAQMVWIS